MFTSSRETLQPSGSVFAESLLQTIPSHGESLDWPLLPPCYQSLPLIIIPIARKQGLSSQLRLESQLHQSVSRDGNSFRCILIRRNSWEMKQKYHSNPNIEDPLCKWMLKISNNKNKISSPGSNRITEQKGPAHTGDKVLSHKSWKDVKICPQSCHRVLPVGQMFW